MPGSPCICAVATETGSSAFSPAGGNTALELRIQRLHVDPVCAFCHISAAWLQRKKRQNESRCSLEWGRHRVPGLICGTGTLFGGLLSARHVPCPAPAACTLVQRTVHVCKEPQQMRRLVLTDEHTWLTCKLSRADQFCLCVCGWARAHTYSRSLREANPWPNGEEVIKD